MLVKSMQEKDIVSVIVPVYKVEKYLRRCVDSILAQTYTNLEIILVDDGSPDDCPRICDEYAQKDKRIKVVHKQNGGVSSARNCGLDNATGDYIAFVDGDDYLQPEMYQKYVENIKIESSDIVIGGYNIERFGCVKRCIETSLQDFADTKKVDYILNYTDCYETKDCYVKNKHIPCYLFRMLFRKKLLDGVSFFEDVRLMEDMLFFLRVLDKNKDAKISVLQEYLYNYVMRDDSAMALRPRAVENSLKFVSHLEKLVNDEELIQHIKYYLYFDCKRLSFKSRTAEDLSDIKKWNTRQNYKACKKHTFGKKEKLKLFLIRHRLFLIYKLLAKSPKK